MAVRAITCIPGVTGDWRYPGGGAAYDTRSFFKGNWPALWRDDLRPPGTRVLAMTRLAEALLTPARSAGAGAPRLRQQSGGERAGPEAGSGRGSPARISSPSSSTTSRRTPPTSPISCSRRRCRPSTPTCTIAYGHAYLAWNAPGGGRRPGECLSNSEIFRRLARALGVTEPCVYDSDEDLARAVLDGDELRLAGITLEALAERGWMRLGEPQPWAPLAKGFPSPSGRLEFYSERAAAAGLDPLPTYTPPYEAVAADADARPALSARAHRPRGPALSEHGVLESPRAARQGGPPARPPARRRCGLAGAVGRRRGPRLERPRRVPGPRPDQRPRPARHRRAAPRGIGPSSIRAARASRPR